MPDIRQIADRHLCVVKLRNDSSERKGCSWNVIIGKRSVRTREGNDGSCTIIQRLRAGKSRLGKSDALMIFTNVDSHSSRLFRISGNGGFPGSRHRTVAETDGIGIGYVIYLQQAVELGKFLPGNVDLDIFSQGKTMVSRKADDNAATFILKDQVADSVQLPLSLSEITIPRTFFAGAAPEPPSKMRRPASPIIEGRPVPAATDIVEIADDQLRVVELRYNSRQGNGAGGRGCRRNWRHYG